MESQLWPQLSAYADALDLTNTMHTSKTDYNLKGNAGHIASVLERLMSYVETDHLVTAKPTKIAKRHSVHKLEK